MNYPNANQNYDYHMASGYLGTGTTPLPLHQQFPTTASPAAFASPSLSTSSLGRTLNNYPSTASMTPGLTPNPLSMGGLGGSSVTHSPSNSFQLPSSHLTPKFAPNIRLKDYLASHKAETSSAVDVNNAPNIPLSAYKDLDPSFGSSPMSTGDIPSYVPPKHSLSGYNDPLSSNFGSLGGPSALDQSTALVAMLEPQAHSEQMLAMIQDANRQANANLSMLDTLYRLNQPNRGTQILEEVFKEFQARKERINDQSLSSSMASTSTLTQESLNSHSSNPDLPNPTYRSPSRHAPNLPPASPPAAAGPPPATILQNLKILRRRDPSIQLILEVFNHVCVYEYDQIEKKWDRGGVEGSMFIYERTPHSAVPWEPTYGIYILNRVGGEDFNQRVCPDDDTAFQGGIWMVRCFPAYTQFRSSRLRAGSVYRKDATVTKEKKEVHGPSKMIGLWIEPGASGSERLSLVLDKLWGAVARGETYDSGSSNGAVKAGRSPTRPTNTVTQAATKGGDDEMGKLDELIKKLQQSSSPPTTSTPNKISMDTLFASASARKAASASPWTREGVETPNPYFATASNITGVESTEPVIHSPQPTTSALPQILNQEVIDSLLGLRAGSVQSVGLGRIGGDGSSREGDVDSSSPSFSDPAWTQSETEEEIGNATRQRGRAQQARGKANGAEKDMEKGKGRENQKEKGRKNQKDKGDNTPKAPPTVPQGSTSFFPESQTNGHGGEEEILELDFGDLSKLGEMEAGKYSPSKLQPTAKPKGKGKAQAVPEIKKTVAVPQHNAHGHENVEEAKLRASIIAHSTGGFGEASQKITTKREFIMQLLEKIHRDKEFGERLWQDYQNHS